MGGDPMDFASFHIWGEFRWTIPFPSPIPDLVDVKYRMDLRATFVWVEWVGDFWTCNVTAGTATAWAEWPYYIFDDPQLNAERITESRAAIEAEVTVWFLAELVVVAWPARLWIDFWVPPPQYGGGGSGIHYWWLEEV